MMRYLLVVTVQGATARIELHPVPLHVFSQPFEKPSLEFDKTSRQLWI